ncbi:MAG: hypothetical protein AAFQ38_18195 [Pseudomonadota bacterium]
MRFIVFLCILTLACCGPDPQEVESAKNEFEERAFAGAAALERRLLRINPLEFPNFDAVGDLERPEIDALTLYEGYLPTGSIIFNGQAFYILSVELELLERFRVIDETHFRYVYKVTLKQRGSGSVLANGRSEFVCKNGVAARLLQVPKICDDIRPAKALEALVQL